MNCTEARLLLHAYLDNELDAARSLELAGHLDACAECMARYRNLEALQHALRAPELQHRAPAALAARIAAQLPHDGIRRTSSRRRSWPALSAALAALLLVAVAIAGWQAWQSRAHQADTLAMEAVSDHQRSLLAAHLIDVRSSDQHTVKPWFDGRLDFSPQVKDLRAQGFELIGGRLDVLGGRRVAALVYKRHLHMINVFEWPADADAAAINSQGSDGYRVIGWAQGGMRFLAVSDSSDLDTFTRDFRSAPMLAAEPR
ncbi:MAG TPA: zf-HC2 domain-containing protein [Rhodanobacteraceae bacterium]|nr:zf-HC2 domain-containing protein [Rhodanobacteraceae bacterium]